MDGDMCKTYKFYSVWKILMIPRKHHFWTFLAITFAVCQIQMILTIIPLQSQHVGMGYAQNIQIVF